MNIGNTRLESDSYHPSAIHPNYLLRIYTHHSQTSSQPSGWLRYACMRDEAPTTHGGGLLRLLPSPTKTVCRGGGPDGASDC